jgi:phosphotransferase system IIA component
MAVGAIHVSGGRHWLDTFRDGGAVHRGVNVSTFRRHVSLGRNVKRNDFFVTLEQRNMEREQNFLRSNVIFTKISRFARTKRET